MGKCFKILPYLLILCCLSLAIPAVHGNGAFQDQEREDTVPVKKDPRRGMFQGLKRYRDSLRNKQYRDSLIRRMTRQNAPEPQGTDSSIIKSEQYFKPFAGKVIRDIYYRKVNVFGPSNIADTTFSTSMRLLHLANRLHYNSQEWVIRQSLFIRQNDTISPNEISANERYLRSRPFIQDARLYIINAGASPDSVDILVVTKDVFEYGLDLSEASPTALRTTVYNNNLFGAGQELRVGASWRNDNNPPWTQEIRYTKYNALGSFVDFSVGYTTLNNHQPIDSGVYEGAWYVSMNRPLYKSDADWVGGVSLSRSFSLNVRGRPDSVYRDYRYQVIDVWGGYNFLKQDRGDPYSGKPNLALLVRHYNQIFSLRPWQTIYKNDPLYNNHRFYLLQAVMFKQDFFKTSHFFGYGRTEDIPLGYSTAFTSGWETWKGRTRGYAGLEGEKFWVTRSQGIIRADAGISSFFRNYRSEDAVVHLSLEYYSRLFRFPWGRLRQFATFDYLGNLNNYFYKPLNINNEFGVWGYRGTLLNGFQRMNLRSETVYYSPLKILGFKFNFFASVQASQLTSQSNNLFKNPIYAGIGAGCRIRNENLPINTIKISANYYPNPPYPVRSTFFEITTITDFRFDIFALRAPAFLQFR
ncbi:BamA/TamA family outer membrane protein [Chitinophaga tropicalis]|uniref:Uncharacterized protein n=1 Tax=Chitinophaga tropicalis TaxID=2683588 RepID=A0A7K1UA09_9BACT|nr:hypothetical protein [Chitinophaga tropicalis]MVT11202.1 hypothetical protein [Chitinophaga tropicalis]